MPIKYIPYYPNTVEGQAVLDNITRTQRVLRYRENDKVYDRIKRGMPYYETELVESIGEAESKNLVIRGECISACAYLKDQGIKIDLVYIDPPFASGADYAKKVYIRRNPKLAEKVAIAEQEMEVDELKAFEEKMYGDIWQKEDYLNWMFENLQAIKSIMSETASIYVHLDWHIGHYVKILMDEVFGEENFRNEIVWNKGFRGTESKDIFQHAHDTIFYYKKADEFIWNQQRIAYKDKENGRYNQVDENGKKFALIKRVRTNGEIYYGKTYFHEEGKKANDVFDIPTMASTDSQRVEYSTQKPEALLERIIKASSNENMLIADFFGGSGVSAKVANDLGRNFIHVDVGLNSIQTIRDRLIQNNADFKILEIKDGVNLFRNPQQTMDKLAQFIPGLQRNVSKLSDFWFGALFETDAGTVPIYVPNLLNTQEKVLDTPTINKIINQELTNLEIEVKKVIVYYIDIDEPQQLQKFINDNNPTQIEIELKDLKNLLNEIVIEDQITYTLTSNSSEHTVEINQFISDRLTQKIDFFNQKGQGKKADMFEVNERAESEESDDESAKIKKKKYSPIIISDEGLELIELVSLDCKSSEGAWHSTTEIKIDKLGYVIKDGIKTKAFWDAKITTNQKPLRLKVRNISGDESIVKL